MATKRIYGLDVARSWAMLLALTAHAMVQVGTPMPSPLIGIVIRTSTPIFILLFGAMIALVHLPRAERDGLKALTRRSWARGIQCYLLFLANVIALWIAVPYSARYAFLCALMLGSTPYAGILQYYTIMFMAMPLAILLLRRVPAPLCLAAAVCVHLAFPQLKSLPTPPPVMGQPILARIVDLTIGTGSVPQIAGPSILHSLVLVFAGFLLGRWLTGASPRGRLWPLLLLFAAAGLWSLTQTRYGPIDLTSLSSMRLRNLNHPAYTFIMGGFALVLILAAVAATRGRRVPDALLVLGRRSLFGFGFGNVIITFWPRTIATQLGAAPSALLLLMVVIAVIFAYDRALARGKPGEAGRFSFPGLIHATATAADRLTTRAANALIRPARHIRRSCARIAAPELSDS